MKKLLLFILCCSLLMFGQTITPSKVITQEIQLGSTSGPKLLYGTADPSAGTGLAAPQGSIYLRTNGTLGTTLYIKGGSANTDWSTGIVAGPVSLAVSPSSLNFGTVQTSSTSPARIVIVSNPSITATLTITSAVFTGNADFSSTNGTISNVVIPPGGSYAISVVYAPTSTGDKTATLTINTNAQTTAPTVALAGTGTGSATKNLSFNCGGGGSGTVVSDEATPLISFTCGNGTPSGDTFNSYVSGSTPQLTATASAGSSFVGFSGSGCGTTSPSTITVSSDMTCTATFAPIPTSHNLTLTGIGNGTGTTTSDVGDVDGIMNCTSTAGVTNSAGDSGCSASYPQGTIVTLHESPAASNNFVGWSGAVGCTTGTDCAVTIGSSDQTVTVNFTSSTVPLSLVQTCYPGSKTVAGKLTCTWSNAINAGDTLICGAWWSDATTTVVTPFVQDTSGNGSGGVYTQLSDSPQTTTGLTHVMYYAANVAAAAAGANTTTFNLSASPTNRSVHCFDYAGLTTTPADGDNAGTGNGTAMASGTVTPTADNDLLVGSDVVAHGVTADTTHGYTQRIYENGNDAEDQYLSEVSGTAHNFQPTQTSTGVWVAHVSAWKIQGQSTTPQPRVTIAGAGSGSGTVGGLPSGTCTVNAGGTSNCSSSVASGANLTLSAVPYSGSQFITWTGGGCSASASCVLNNVTNNITVTVRFDLSGTQNYYVGGTGASDSNDGLAATVSGGHGPWATIQKAVNSNTPTPIGPNGTTIHVAAGSYSVAAMASNADPICGASCNMYHIFIGKSGLSTSQRLVLECAAQFQCLISPSDNIVQEALINAGLCCTASAPGGNFVDVIGFDVTGTSTADATHSTQAGIELQGTYDRAIGNYIHHIMKNDWNGPYGIYTGYSAATNGTGAFCQDACPTNYVPVSHGQQVIGNVIVDVGIPTGSGFRQANVGIYAAAPDQLIENNIIYNNPAVVTAQYCMTSNHWGLHSVYANNVLNCGDNAGGIAVHMGDGPFDSNLLMTTTTYINNVIIHSVANGYAFRESGAVGSSLLFANNACDTASCFVNTNSGGALLGTFSGTLTGINPSTFFNGYVSGNQYPKVTVNGFTINGSGTDYTLKAGSAGINGGMTICVTGGQTPCVPSVDILNNPRPIGPAIDIGAYEQ